MAKLLDCNQCLLYVHHPHLICVVYPTGVEGDRYLDFEPDPTLEPEEWWQPGAAAYYNGELILQPEQKWSLEQQLALLESFVYGAVS